MFCIVFGRHLRHDTKRLSVVEILGDDDPEVFRVISFLAASHP